jgi:hypothetical protein
LAITLGDRFFATTAQGQHLYVEGLGEHGNWDHRRLIFYPVEVVDMLLKPYPQDRRVHTEQELLWAVEESRTTGVSGVDSRTARRSGAEIVGGPATMRGVAGDEIASTGKRHLGWIFRGPSESWGLTAARSGKTAAREASSIAGVVYHESQDSQRQ